MEYETLYAKTNVALNNQTYFRPSKLFYSFMHDFETSLCHKIKRRLKQETNHLIGSQIYSVAHSSIEQKVIDHLRTYGF